MTTSGGERDDGRSQVRFAVTLALWPIVAGAAGNMLIAVNSQEWGDPVAIAMAGHLGAVAIAPAAALTTLLGLALARANKAGVAFALLPILAPIVLVPGVMLHYCLVDPLSWGVPVLFSSSDPMSCLFNAAAVSLLALGVVGFFAARGRR